MKQGRRLLSLAALAGAMLWCAAAARADDGVNVPLPNAALSTISDPNDALSYARSRIEAHDMQGAVYGLERYLTNHPEEYLVEQFLGDLYISNGDLKDAEAVYKRLLLAFPLSHDLHSRLGRLYVVENRTDAAIEQFQASLPDVESIYYLVMLHQRKGDLPAFRDRTRQFADAHPKDVDAQLAAGQLFGALYMLRDSALEFQRALAANPNSLEALEGFALAQISEKAYAGATKTIVQCLSLDASNYGCLDALGILDTQTHQYDAAQAALEHAYRLAPEEPEALVGLAHLDDARGDWQNAIAMYDRALYVWPYSGDAYMGIAYDDEEHGLVTNAEQEAIKGLSMTPDDAALHCMLGYVYQLEGRRALAVTQFVAAEQSLDPMVSGYAKQSAAALQHP